MTAVRFVKKFASALREGDMIELPDSAARILNLEGWTEPLDNPQLTTTSSFQLRIP